MAVQAENTHVERQLLNPRLTKIAKSQFAKLNRLDISGYTYERRHSNYPEARSDYLIFDENGALAYHAREFRDKRIFFWQQ
jgi:hypothetical protein